MTAQCWLRSTLRPGCLEARPSGSSFEIMQIYMVLCDHTCEPGDLELLLGLQLPKLGLQVGAQAPFWGACWAAMRQRESTGIAPTPEVPCEHVHRSRCACLYSWSFRTRKSVSVILLSVQGASRVTFSEHSLWLLQSCEATNASPGQQSKAKGRLLSGSCKHQGVDIKPRIPDMCQSSLALWRSTEG